MNVMEIYRSIQGEGMLMGVPTTFVRFFACNLRCSWCDTRYSWSKREGGTWESMPSEDVAERIEALGVRHVVLTGGEPTLQKELPQLARLLKEQGHHVTIETNATIFPARVIPLIDLWSLSPKLTSAGQGYIRLPVVQAFVEQLRVNQQQWKFVVRGDGDIASLQDLLARFPRFREQQLPLILQPEGSAASPDYAQALERLAEQVRQPFWQPYYVRVLPQLHVLIWGQRKLV
jgi:7-carboxy-7-deazaguanine synthase